MTTDPTCSATRQKYDVIICGTDLCQSILSSALSRAGKKVLHCDGNDWYGGFDAVLYGGSTLDCFIESCLHNQQCDEEEGAAKKTEHEISNRVESDEGIDSLRLLPKEKYASLKLHSQTVIVQENDNKIAAADDVATSDDIDQPTTIEHLSLQNDATNTENKSQISDDNNTTAIDDSNDQLGGFSLDISPCLLYASGDAVEGLVKSGVSDYLEFKSVEGLFVLMAEDDSSTSSARRGNRNRNKSGDTNGSSGDVKANEKPLISYRVPMSKSDVFRSKLLSPVDKRRLMKFLQLITDYGMAMASQIDEEAGEQSSLPEDSNNIEVEKSIDITSNMGEDVIQSVNERRLHRGRALSRPQNKATPSSSDMESLLRCVRDGISFSDFLKTVVKLPERLAIVVVYALALSPFGYNCNDTIEPKTDAMTRVSQYSTKEGVEDLLLHVTALGRFGHTAFLTAMYGSGELSQSFCRSGAVYGSTYMLRRSPLRITFETGSQVRGVVLGGEGHIGGFGDVDTTDASDEEILCEHVIVPSTMIDPSLLQNASQSRIYRRISILRGKLVAAQEDQSDTDNASKTEQRYAIIIPPGTRGLSNQSAIHAVVVDDSVCVSPRGKQYTVLHLTMSSFPGDCYSDEVFDETLGQAVQYLIRSQTSNEGTSPVVECHHVTFSFTSDSPQNTEENQNPRLHIAYRDLQSITCDSAFREAKRIFDKICPDADFLALAKKVEDEIVYRNEEDSDDERVVLDSAVTMIEAPLPTGKTSEETATLSCGETSDEEAKPEIIEKTSEAGLEAATRPS